jgi:hypothetical protein
VLDDPIPDMAEKRPWPAIEPSVVGRNSVLSMPSKLDAGAQDLKR